jgi:hypothetical protein
VLTFSRSFMNVANGVLWRMAIILKANKVNLYLLFCLFSGTIHRTFETHHVHLMICCLNIGRRVMSRVLG